MSTAVFQIEFKDGRTYRIFCANSNQQKKVRDMYHQDLNGKVKNLTTVTNGLHTVNQFKQIIARL